MNFNDLKNEVDRAHTIADTLLRQPNQQDMEQFIRLNQSFKSILNKLHNFPDLQVCPTSANSVGLASIEKAPKAAEYNNEVESRIMNNDRISNDRVNNDRIIKKKADYLEKLYKLSKEHEYFQWDRKKKQTR